MARTPLIAGNWKMNKTVHEALVLVAELMPRLHGLAGVEVAVCPPATALTEVNRALAGSAIGLGAQDVFWADSGAFTGMLSPPMLRDVGCKYAIIGHSERRGRFGKPDECLNPDAARVFGDTDASVNLKLKAALKHGLVPIVCVGETLPERDDGLADKTVAGQVRAGLADVAGEAVAGIVFAYEPVWAIGTGRACDAPEANRVTGVIRKTLHDAFGSEVAQAVRIQYGGSVNERNAHDLLSQPEIDGALVGGASLDASRFSQIVQATSVIAKDTRKD
ncbi:MAG: triose-phosphate isomerase [Armatimonadota bacterium]|nr:MAG: triose-phosphate isomerase [Armatimonadota bacterium]